jgi:glycerophosphoryl diester phosphodiesterase
MLGALISLNRVSAIAHRGGSKLRPENTLAAFDHAASLGVDALECDVHLSRDGEAVVIHDATLDRTCDVPGPVSGRTAAELGRVDAGFSFGPDIGYPFRGLGCGVPMLRDLLDRYRDRPIIIEIKGEDLATADRVIGILREHGAFDRVILGGFSHAVLEAVRRAAPQLATGASSLESRRALTRSYFRLSPSRPVFQLFQMPFRLRGRQMFGKSFVTAARRGRIPVHAWIVDQSDEMATLIGWGVTGIISDRPDLAIEAIRAATAPA